MTKNTRQESTGDKTELCVKLSIKFYREATMTKANQQKISTNFLNKNRGG